MELYGLPEMLGRIVGRSVQMDAFFDRVPVGENSCWDGWRSAPAVERMFPLLLNLEEGLRVSRRGWLFHPAQGGAKLAGCVSDQGLERSLIHHRNDPAFYGLAHQSAAKPSPRGGVKGAVAFPPVGLSLDIREGFRERCEFDVSVDGKLNGASVLGDDGGGSDN